MARRRVIAVIGAGEASPKLLKLAFLTGRELGARGAVLVCGGLGGVMEAAARGARAARGHTIGIIPGYRRESANRHIEFVVATGMGEARNAIVVASAEAVIALSGETGTLSEIALALKLGRRVVALDSWHELSGLHRADTPEAAVELALELASAKDKPS